MEHGLANVFDNKYLWVWQVERCGGAEKVVKTAKALGYGLCVKYHDGDPADDTEYNYVKNFGEVIEFANQENVPVLAWGYCYGDKYGNLEKEAKAAAETQKAGARGYVIDAENEWESSEAREWARKFMSEFKSLAPRYPVAYTTFWNLRWHPMLPAREFVGGGCMASMPQIYFGLAKRRSYEDQRQMVQIAFSDFNGLGVPVYPVAEVTTPGDFVNFLELAGSKACSIWSLDQMTPQFRDILAMIALREHIRALFA